MAKNVQSRLLDFSVFSLGDEACEKLSQPSHSVHNMEQMMCLWLDIVAIQVRKCFHVFRNKLLQSVNMSHRSFWPQSQKTNDVVKIGEGLFYSYTYMYINACSLCFIAGLSNA
jgi:hypothetical protein